MDRFHEYNLHYHYDEDNYGLLSLYLFEVVFVLGRINDPSKQKLVDAESRGYRDILQEDFLDSYNNLTLKALMMVKWASKNYLGKGNPMLLSK